MVYTISKFYFLPLKKWTLFKILWNLSSLLFIYLCYRWSRVRTAKQTYRNKTIITCNKKRKNVFIYIQLFGSLHQLFLYHLLPSIDVDNYFFFIAGSGSLERMYPHPGSGINRIRKSKNMASEIFFSCQKKRSRAELIHRAVWKVGLNNQMNGCLLPSPPATSTRLSNKSKARSTRLKDNLTVTDLT